MVLLCQIESDSDCADHQTEQLFACLLLAFLMQQDYRPLAQWSCQILKSLLQLMLQYTLQNCYSSWP